MDNVITTAQDYWSIASRLRRNPTASLIRTVAVRDMQKALAKTTHVGVRNRMLLWLAHNQPQSPSTSA